jgi:uncharacterized membrane protein YphA (DoxX/SURF4 family)
MNTKGMSSLVPDYMPGPMFWVYLTGIALIGSGVFIIGRLPYVRLVCILLAVMLLGFVAMIHVPGLSQKSQAQMAMIGLLKDSALAGAAIVLAAVLPKRKE